MSTLNVSNRGRSLELVIVASQCGIIALDQIPQSARRLPGGRVIAQKGPVDFIGTVCGTGRHIVFDAKRCQLKTRFDVGHRDHFAPHQREFLLRHGAAGAISGLVVESTHLSHFLWLDWRDIRDLRDAPSLEWSSDRWLTLGANTHLVKFGRLLEWYGRRLTTEG